VDLLLAIHQSLLARTRLREYGGKFREQQNWIGGNAHNPCTAVFIPPPPELVSDLVSDLVAFSNDDSLPAVAQAAIAHSQFETIHPFVDGNGRTGRALIHLILRYRGPGTSKAAREGTNLWVGLFATACSRAVDDAASFEQQACAIEAKWRERLGRVRARSAADLLLRLLIGAPVVTVNNAADLIGRSFVHTNE
jgi:prophage maintenance system killer protein